MLLLVVNDVGSSPASVAISFVLLILLTIFKAIYNRVLETVKVPDQTSVQGGNEMNIAKACFKDILIALGELAIDKAIEISHSIRLGSLAKAYRTLSDK